MHGNYIFRIMCVCVRRGRTNAHEFVCKVVTMLYSIEIGIYKWLSKRFWLSMQILSFGSDHRQHTLAHTCTYTVQKIKMDKMLISKPWCTSIWQVLEMKILFLLIHGIWLLRTNFVPVFWASRSGKRTGQICALPISINFGFSPKNRFALERTRSKRIGALRAYEFVCNEVESQAILILLAQRFWILDLCYKR